jgi:DNA invertase Pin-like site-specific DNA recombinase
MLAMVDEIERDLINERTKDGLRVRKATGVVLNILTVEKAG